MAGTSLEDACILPDAIYEAAVIPEAWPAVLDRIAEMVVAAGGGLIASPATARTSLPLITSKIRWVTSDGLTDMMAAFFGEGWIARCPWVGRARAMEHPGFVTDRDLFAPGEHEKSSSYDFYRRFGFGFGAGLFIRVPSSDNFAFVFERRHEIGPFGFETIEMLNSLRPHLARAALIACRLGLERAYAASQALALLGLPAAVLCPLHRVLAANEQMQALMSSQAEERAGGRFHLTNRRADTMLSVALGNALLAGDCVGRPKVFSIPLAAREDGPAMVAHVVPVRRQARDIFASAANIVVITPVCGQELPAAEVIQALFDLTAAETRVARMIAGGGTVSTIASDSQTTEGTVRNQLKSVFAKTGVSRQADLVSLLNATSLRRDRAPATSAS